MPRRYYDINICQRYYSVKIRHEDMMQKYDMKILWYEDTA